ncbi:hypothetical protein J8J40_34030, partial [Mycobacterium tuberculosis]|nr:hypothetical protein [Mycobacterium tuberculosis]
MTYSTGSVAETIEMTEGGTPMPVRFSVADSTMNADVTGQAAKGFLDLWSFLVAHPAKDALANDQAALKTRILA